MLKVRKIGRGFYADFIGGEKRIRGALGTRNQKAASERAHNLEVALSQGSESDLWSGLKNILPCDTFVRFADYAGWKEKQLPTWTALHAAFETHMAQRIAVGKLQESTAERYRVTISEFSLYLAEQRISFLQDITKPLVEAFKVWRKARIESHKFSRGATGLVLDTAILHRVFAFALENEMILKNPVRMEGRPGENPTGGAEPFNGDELAKLRENAGDDLLAFLLLRWTGLRGSDAVTITWNEVHFDRREIERKTQKRRKLVIIPIQTELLFALEAERDRRNPQASDRILLNPETDKPMIRPRLYERMKRLGKRAGVANVHPHRFRDTLAVDMLSRGASPYDVAKLLGDTIETIERHYTPFVRELRERVRNIMESEGGLEGHVNFTVKLASKSDQKVM